MCSVVMVKCYHFVHMSMISTLKYMAFNLIIFYLFLKAHGGLVLVILEVTFSFESQTVFLCCHLKDCWLYYKEECLLQHTEDSIMLPACQTKLILWTGSKPHWQLATIHQKLKRWGDENKRESICINKHGTLPKWWRYSGNTLSSSPWSGPGNIQRQKMGKKGVKE